MFQAFGSVLDRYWTAVVGLCGVIALGLFGTVWQDADEVIGEFWLITLIVLAALGSGVSGVYPTVRYARRARRLEAELFTAVKTTLVPLAEHIIDSPPEGSASDLATIVTAHIRAFVERAGTTCDANLYKLSGNDLVRQNRPSSAARKAFRKTWKEDPRSKEEAKAVERVKSGVSVFCPDTRSRRARNELCLAPGPRAYRAFISVPLRTSEEEIVGMLSLNSSRKGVLTPLHQEYLEAVGRIYTASMR